MDGRLYRRFVVDREIDCRIGNRIERVFLYDLSASGCMIETMAKPVVLGACLSVKFTHFIEAHGEVVWQIGQNAGVRFDELLPKMIVEHLGFKPTELNFEDILPKDRFGRPLPSLPSQNHRPPQSF